LELGVVRGPACANFTIITA